MSRWHHGFWPKVGVPVFHGRDGICSNVVAHERYHHAAAGAVQRRALFGRRREAAGIEFELQVPQGYQALAVGVQEAVIAGATKSTRQRALHDRRGKLPMMERRILLP